LPVKNPETLYFISDTETICLGSEKYVSGIEISGDAGNLITLTDDGIYASVDVIGNVTGVKGVAEDEYRTGDIAIAPEDIGAESNGNKTYVLSDQSSHVQYPSAKAVYDELLLLNQGKVDKNGTDRLMTASEATKLAGIAAGAQVNTPFATLEEAVAGTSTDRLVSPYLAKKEIEALIVFDTTIVQRLEFSSKFEEIQRSYFIADPRGLVTIECFATKTAGFILIKDVLAVLTKGALPQKGMVVLFPFATYENEGDEPKMGLCSINDKGEITFLTEGLTNIAFNITYSNSVTK
jgi:hypothetical protein